MLIYDSFSFIGRKHYTIGKISFVSLTYIYIYVATVASVLTTR